MVSVDIYRPAAQQQLAINAKNYGFNTVDIVQNQKPLDILNRAITQAKNESYDYLIIDTAGRNQLSEDLMSEMKQIHQACNPIEVIFVVDAMIGRSSLNTISAFNDQIKLTGIIPTKMDGDSKGGVILNAKSVTGLNIKFFSNGEKIDDFEEFIPERIASRIVGTGDIDSIIEKVNKQMGGEDVKQKMEAKIKSGKIDFNDLLSNLEMIGNLGGFEKVMDFLPFANKMKEMMGNKMNTQDVKKQISVIKSMTKKERSHPSLIKDSSSRRARVAKGSGTKFADVNKVIKKLEEASMAAKKMNQFGGKFDPETISKMLSQVDGGVSGGFGGGLNFKS